MTEPFNVLVSSVGRRVALLETLRASLRVLGLQGSIVGADASRLSSGFHAADCGVSVPRCDHDEFVPAMLAICAQHGIRLVIPTIDPELPVLAGARSQFEAMGCRVAVSGPKTVAIGADKRQTHTWLEAHSFPTVRQATLDEVASNQDQWDLPLIVKPRAGSASVGVRVVSEWRELLGLARSPETIVEELAPGDEYTIDVLVNRAGKPICAVPRRRLEVRAGEVSKGVTVRDPTLEALAAAVAEALSDAYGPLTTQVFLDRDEGRPRVIEINPRFGGGYPLSFHAGARFPQWIIEEIVGLPSTATSDQWQSDVVMLRYDDAIFVDGDQAGIGGSA